MAGVIITAAKAEIRQTKDFIGQKYISTSGYLLISMSSSVGEHIKSSFVIFCPPCDFISDWERWRSWSSCPPDVVELLWLGLFHHFSLFVVLPWWFSKSFFICLFRKLFIVYFWHCWAVNPETSQSVFFLFWKLIGCSVATSCLAPMK